MPRALADILKDVLSNLQAIVRLEVNLAKAELRDEIKQIRTVVILISAGVLAVILASGFALLALLYVLVQVMPHWFAALLIACLLTALSALLIALGIRRFKTLPGSAITVKSLKKDMQWAKHPTG